MAEQQPKVLPDGKSTAARPGIGKRVLIVNDTQEILELFDEILRQMGFEVVLMSYAPRELEQIRNTDADIVILDFIFGPRELEGWQLLQKIRMDPALETIPIIVCSAAMTEVKQQEGYLTEQGVLIVLKPFTVSQLEEAVRRAVRMADVRAAPPSAEIRKRIKKGPARKSTTAHRRNGAA
jgi:DNA-binding response OmpR family regulator